MSKFHVVEHGATGWTITSIPWGRMTKEATAQLWHARHWFEHWKKAEKKPPFQFKKLEPEMKGLDPPPQIFMPSERRIIL
jgi:hypothetical protein